jgi:hypothetical protein
MNGDPIAYGIQDAGTSDYLKALDRQAEKDLNIATTVAGLAGTVLRGVSAVAELATNGSRLTEMASSALTSSSGAASGVASSKNYGVTFFGDDILTFFDDPTKATIGKPGAPSFFMSAGDAALVQNAHDAAIYTGMAPSAQKAYSSGGEIYGFSFPTDGLAVAKPTAIDAGGWPHFLEGGYTAVKTDGANSGYMLTPVREFVTSGSNSVPAGSVLFKIGSNGEWIPIRKW